MVPQKVTIEADKKISLRKINLGEKPVLIKTKKNFFLEFGWNYEVMIDYGLTFRKRGRKAYLTLIGREIYLLKFHHFWSLVQIIMKVS